MKVQSCSLNCDALKGAVLSNSQGAEMGVILDITFDLQRHEVFVLIRQKGNGISGISWDSMRDWNISLQSETWTNNIDNTCDEISDVVESIFEHFTE